MNFWQEDLNKSKQFEVWLSQEKKEEFDKNLNEFNSKYSKKLENVLPEDILKKVSGSFESSWNIENTISNLKNDWLLEKNIESLKKYLIENKELSSEDLKNIKEEFEKKLISYFKGNMNVDIKSLQGINIPIYRMRLGAYRIIFTRKNGDIIIIYTVDAGNRGEIYNNIKNIKKNLKF